MDESGRLEAEEAFERYDFERDDRFLQFRNNANVITAGDVESKLRRIYFHKYKDSRLDKDRRYQPPTTSNSSSTRSRQTQSSSAANQTNTSSSNAQNPTNRNIQPLPARIQQVLDVLSGPQSRSFFAVFILATSVLSVLPILAVESSFSLYKKAHMASMIVCAIGAINKSGMPAWNAEYAQRMIRLDEVQYFLFSFVFRGSGAPILLSVFPPSVFACYSLIGAIQQIVRNPEMLPAVYIKARNYSVQYRSDALRIVATTEVLLMLNILLSMNPIVPKIMTMMGHFQFLKLRSATNPTTRYAITSIDSRIQSLVGQYVPFILPYYRYLRSMILSYANAGTGTA